MAETIIGIVFLIAAVICGLVVRFEPTYAADRSKRYIQPPRGKGVK